MKKKLVITMIASLIVVLFATSCNKESETEKNDASAASIVIPKDFGNGVFYFKNCTEEAFAISLAHFLSDTSRHLACIQGDNKGSYGKDLGYFVVIEQKSTPKVTGSRIYYGPDVVLY